jgi:DmX-like protein
VLFPSRSLEHNQSMGSFLGNPTELNYGFVYVAHPRAVTHISWRKTSKYMPKGSVSNMLVTSCLDNICRIWVETVLPDDGLVNMNQFDPLASQNPKFRTHRHKHRFMQRLKHMKTCFHIRRHAKHNAASGMAAGFGGLGTSNGLGHAPIPTLPSTYSVHDFHSYGYHGTGVTPGLHFHLAASINAETDIPLVPSMQTNDPAMQPNFILHWLNNKEMHFSLQAEGIMQEMTRKLIERDELHTGDNSNSEHSDEHQGVAPDEIKKKLNKMNKSMSHDDSQHSEEVQPTQQQQQQHANRSHSIGTGSQVCLILSIPGFI